MGMDVERPLSYHPPPITFPLPRVMLGTRRCSVILFWVIVLVGLLFEGVCGPSGKRYDSTYNTKPVKWFLKEGSDHSLIRKTEMDRYKGLLLITCDTKRFLKVSSNIILLHVGIRVLNGIHSGLVVKKEDPGGDVGWIPGSGRSPGEENGNHLQYSCLKNPIGSPWGHKRVRHDLATKQQQSVFFSIICWG